MKNLFRSLVLSLLVSTSLFAKIIEVKKMSEILSEVTRDSLVVFDLDNTIMEAAQTLGSDQWFEHRIKQQISHGLSQEEATLRTMKEWEAINHKGKVQLVERSTPSLIRQVQSHNIPTMGLTARPATFLEKSLSQLEDLDVHFYRSTVSDEEITLKDKDTATFKDGLMSVGRNNKGTILLSLLERVDFHPERIIFVDDKVKNVTNVDNALKQTSIESFAFRYGAADPKVAAFDERLADFAFDYFKKTGEVLSDERARLIMESQG